MTYLVNPDQIESIVGIQRHQTNHYGRVVSKDQMVYILHSKDCLEERSDLRTCPFSLALDRGIAPDNFEGYEDRPIILAILGGYLWPWGKRKQ